jgi:DNA topoisomerase III
MPTLIITEKTSQARDLRAALGDRFGQILPAEGHLLRLAEPHEVEPSWKTWTKPDGLYPTQPATEGNQPAKLKAIAAALQRCNQVILATDCDREGQLIGQEILEHRRGTEQRRSTLSQTANPMLASPCFTVARDALSARRCGRHDWSGRI